jgi:phosphatidylglycerophosphate synthase
MTDRLASSNAQERLRLVGDLPVELFGLALREWQRRAWDKAGASEAQGRLVVASEWVLSAGLMAALVDRPGAALAERTGDGSLRLVAVHACDDEQAALAEALMTPAELDLRAAAEAGLFVSNASGIAGSYNHKLRKREAPFALDLLTHPVSEVEARLFRSAYKGVTDFVTKYAWPAPALAVTRWCARRRITPNLVTMASLVLTILAFWWFWQGDWLPGFAAAWAMTFLDTVDGKLARTTMTSSKWGNLFDHGIDLVHPPFWYWAWYHGATGNGLLDASAPGWVTLSLWLILAGYAADRLVEGYFIGRHGFHIHVWQPADSFMREITARRNPNTFLFMLAVVAGAPMVGLAVVAAWTVVCLLFHVVRAYEAEGAPRTSWLEAA